MSALVSRGRCKAWHRRARCRAAGFRLIAGSRCTAPVSAHVMGRFPLHESSDVVGPTAQEAGPAHRAAPAV